MKAQHCCYFAITAIAALLHYSVPADFFREESAPEIRIRKVCIATIEFLSPCLVGLAEDGLMEGRLATGATATVFKGPHRYRLKSKEFLPSQSLAS